MQFGISSCLPDLSHVEQRERLFDDIIAEVQVAEQVGFDSCLMTEHHQHLPGSFPSPLLVAAAIAARTTRLRVGSGVLLLPLYHPVRVAEDGAMVDLLSKGRLILGVGAGVVDADFAAVGVPRRQRPSRFEEGLQIVRRAWTEESVSFFGHRYQLHNVAVTPKPWQQPHPPIWAGGMADEGIKRAARLGDAWFMDILNNTHTLGQRAILYRHTCTQWGKPPYIVALREAWVADTTAQADHEYAPHVMGFHRGAYRAGAYHPATEPWLATVTSEAEFTYEKVKQNRFIVGSPEDCIRQIEALQQATGVNYLVLRFRHPTGPTHAHVCQAIQRFGEQVIPHFV
jgi:alkanesulfonate monooxygenase SsuD/methylene tetrahydromethanopterin reductase-like flavin-dependent oxidoreductase (luciferase family)